MNMSNKSDERKIQFPLKGSMQYEQLHATKEDEIKLRKQYKHRNRIVKFLYRIGVMSLFRITRFMALLYTIGRKTGKTIVNPVSYNYKDGGYYVQASRGDNAHWIKNMRANPDDVYLRVGWLKKIQVKPTFLSNEKEDYYWKWYVQNNSGGFTERLIGWNKDEHQVENADFSQLIKKITIVKLIPVE